MSEIISHSGFWLSFCSSAFLIRICDPKIIPIKPSGMLMTVTTLTL